jgi:hypothetical protein
MKRLMLLASAAMLIGADSPQLAQASDASTAQVPSQIRTTVPKRSGVPPFAANLAQQRSIVGPNAWRILPQDKAWRILATARPSDRQQARFDYARSMIGQERGAEALGALDVMRQDDPDLAMVDAYRLARGAALTQIHRFDEASTELSAVSLSGNPEACLWRMRALALSGFAEQAIQQMSCAAPVFANRPTAFALAAAQAAIEGGKPADAIRWLRGIPDRDPAANLLRGRAELALGQQAQARLRFARVEESGSVPLRMDARLSQIEAEVASGSFNRAAVLKRLDALRYSWRGDGVEERALRLTYRLNADAGDLRGALVAGATLFRFFDTSRQGADFLAGLQAKLGDVLDPAQKMPLEQAAGLYWDYRDLSPSGAEGDLLVNRLAERLQAAGMYGRAADLLEYQLFNRAGELARGPLSARVGGLHILAGRPDRALEVIKRSADPDYPDSMVYARKRVEAVALTHIGRVPEAFAVLQGVPDAAALRAEIMWKRRDWQGVANETADALPRSGGLSEVAQAVVLRHAIALAMLGQEDMLASLRQRYQGSFQGLRTEPVFEMLTGSAKSVDPEKLARAMAAIPSASAAGEIAALLEPTPVVSKL